MPPIHRIPVFVSHESMTRFSKRGMPRMIVINNSAHMVNDAQFLLHNVQPRLQLDTVRRHFRLALAKAGQPSA